uniref:phosphatidylinositol-3,4,5-trisphosphate 5-phosphatase n=1 Tax=Scleropages formosus TaxID=113540 RepID=A0A8C9U378_SCLFO
MAGGGLALPSWYQRDLSRAAAEELLARAGRDGSFLVRDSESVNGAYALCVLFQKHVHTYRILPDEDGFLAVQTSQGVQPKRFKTLPELIQLYLQPNQGLVTTLLYPVEREESPDDKDYSGKISLQHCNSSSQETTADIRPITTPASSYCLQRGSNGLSTISHEYLKGSYALDLEAVKQGASNLPHLNKTLVSSCKRLHGEVDKVLAGLEILSKVFDQQSALMVSRMIQQVGRESKPTLYPCEEASLLQKHLPTHLNRNSMPLGSSQFIFQKREAFCQLLQLMKNKHSNQDEPDMISIFIGSWNMGSVPPPKVMTSWLVSRGLGKTLDEMTVTIPHDIYVIGTQENSVCDKEWVEMLRAALKDCTELDYKLIAMQTLWNIKIAVLVKPEHENRISHVGVSSVKTGIANTLGNKGAVGVSFMFNGTSFGFVNCHLTSGNEKISRRNQNYLDILRLLSLGDRQLSSFDISLRFTHLFWFGDLNYRLDMDIQDILNYINRKEFEPLLKVDQLNLEREKNKVFLRFAEEEISYPPTYRYERGSRDTYVWQKQKPTGMRTNVPSWCDRILWKSYPETHIVCNSYGCTDDIVTSDHSPVFATFEVGVTSQFSSEQAYIEFESIEAIVKTASRTKFFIEFYSTCLEEFKKSYENDTQNSDNINFLRVGWSSKQLTTLKPILSDIEYLQDQHLLLTVKSLDGYESYGECVLALKSMIGSTPQQFHTYLSHRGEETGNIRGSMRVRPDKRHFLHAYEKKILSFFDFRSKQDSVESDPSTCKNSYNNPAYYILEGVPNQSAALAPDMLPSSALPPKAAAPSKSKAPAVGSIQHRKQTSGRPPARPASDEGSSEEDGSPGPHGGTLNRPPPDFPPPPLPKGAIDMTESPFYTTSKEAKCRNLYPDLADIKPSSAKPQPSSGFLPPHSVGGSGAFCMESPPVLGPPTAPFRRGGTSGLDDQSCSVLQMAKTLSEVEYQPGRDKNPAVSHKAMGHAHLRGMGLPDPCRTFPPHSIHESIAEDLPEEVRPIPLWKWCRSVRIMFPPSAMTVPALFTELGVAEEVQ